MDQSPVIVVASQEADPARIAAIREAGAETLVASGSASGERIASALSDLGRRSVTSLFLEGGSTLAAAFVAADQIDQARTFVAPVLLDGFEPGDSAVSRAGGTGEGGSRTTPPAAPPLPP